MRAAVYHPPSTIQVEELPIPKIGAGEILLKVRACGVCGTDVLKVTRALPKSRSCWATSWSAKWSSWEAV